MPLISPPRPGASNGDGVDTSPLLGHSVDHLQRSRRLLRRPVQPLRGTAARILRQASGRRLRLRGPSMQVRDNAAEQLESQQSDWAYSKPIVVLDILWNLALVGVALHVLVLSTEEAPDVPLRLWILGYILQCSFHIVCVMVEFMRRRREMEYAESDRNWRNTGDLGSFLSSSSGSEGDSEDYAAEPQLDDDETSIAKHLESANTMFSFVWWIIGFYWVDAGGQDLTHDAPQLYWICVIFLVLDVVFVVLCVSIAGLIGIAVCCCLPCIIAILYAVTDQEGATREDIDRLPKFKFRSLGDYEKVNGENQPPFGGVMIECGTDSPLERALSQEDAECCICICSYDDGSEICELPCNHHFHTDCIEKWLYINATCPLCKFNILKCENASFSE